MNENPDGYGYTWSTEPDHDALQASKDRDAIYRVGGLRDQFAAAALTGLLDDESNPKDAEMLAVDAYRFADAMLAARKATKP